LQLNDHLYALMAPHAARVTIERLYVGLRYTAVTISDGGIGLAYTYHEDNCTTLAPADYTDCEEQSAIVLLEKIKRIEPAQRSQGLALINALNYGHALLLPEDPDNHILYNALGVRAGCKVAMVGYFRPLVAYLEDRGVALEIIDFNRGLGQKDRFYAKLDSWADALLLTSTSILNSTTEEIIGYVNPKVKTVMLGPSTPMIAEAFRHLPVQMLAGTVPIDKAKVLKAVRHGLGTRVIHRFSKKVFWTPTGTG